MSRASLYMTLCIYLIFRILLLGGAGLSRVARVGVAIKVHIISFSISFKSSFHNSSAVVFFKSSIIYLISSTFFNNANTCLCYYYFILVLVYKYSCISLFIFVLFGISNSSNISDISSASFPLYFIFSSNNNYIYFAFNNNNSYSFSNSAILYNLYFSYICTPLK